MTKKVTLDKNEYDQMEKEIERLKSINEELVKGASVVLDPEININFEREGYVYSRGFVSHMPKTTYKGAFITNIKTTTESLPKSKHLEGLYKILESQIKDRLKGHINSKLSSIKREEDRLETTRNHYSQKHQEALDKLDIIKKGYEARPKNRYIAMGVFIGAMLTYLIM